MTEGGTAAAKTKPSNGTKNGSTNNKKKELDEEERIRERLKQRQEARRNSRKDSDPETTKKKESTPEKKGKAETPSTASSSGNKRSRRGRRHRHRHRHRERHREERNNNPHFNSNGGNWRGPPPPHLRHRGGPPPPRGRWEQQQQGPPSWRGGPPPRGGGPPPDWRGRPPPPQYRGGGGGDWGGGYGSGRRGSGSPPSRYRRSRSLSRSRSYSRSVSRSSSASSRSRSRSRSRSYSSRSSRSHSSSRSRSYSRSRSRSRSRSHRRRHRSHSYSDDSVSDDASSASSVSSREDEKDVNPSDALTKDQRTVFLSQLVMRTTERDISKYFRKVVGCKVNDVILLRDKRTGRHKGIAYVELRQLEDVPKAVAVSGQAPDFQRFPILVKASEAEKNYMPGANTVGVATGPMMGPDGKLYEAQKVYVGNLDRTISSEHVYSVFQHFGQLDKVSLQIDTTTGESRGFVFLSYRDPKSANLAIQAMSGQVLAGRQLKTGWASQTSNVPGVEVRTSDEFPEDATVRIQNAQVALAQMQGAGLLLQSSVTPAVGAVPAVASVAEAALDAAFGGLPGGPAAINTAAATVTPAATTAASTTQEDPKKIGGNPSQHILVHNMFDKDEETDEGWEEEIRLDFEEECSKYGKMESIKVMSKEPGGKIYASFSTLDGAKTCASSLAGRWFDKRQLKVEYVEEDDVP